MVHTLKLNGENRTVLFGNLAFKKLKEEKGLALGDVVSAMQNMDVTILSTVLYYGLRVGERYEKRIAEDYTTDDVAFWMDVQGGVPAKILPWITEAITDMSGEAAPPEEAKKKAKAARETETGEPVPNDQEQNSTGLE